jgi:hypothetical protein
MLNVEMMHGEDCGFGTRMGSFAEYRLLSFLRVILSSFPLISWLRSWSCLCENGRILGLDYQVNMKMFIMVADDIQRSSVHLDVYTFLKRRGMVGRLTTALQSCQW